MDDEFFAFLALLALIFSLIALIKGGRCHNALQLRIAKLEREAVRLAGLPAAGTAVGVAAPTSAQAPVHAQAPAAASPPASVYGSVPVDSPFRADAPDDWSLPEPKPTAPLKPKKPSVLANPRWIQLQNQLKSNWTGVLGSVILVTGVAFFGVLASLFIGPEGRFALILGFAAAFFGGGLWLRRKPGWVDFAGWLTAISGAVALFACLGAGGVDGLKFLDDPLIGLAVLVVGVAINVTFAFMTRQQAIAALHVVLSLCALAVAPAQSPVLLVGTAAALAGIGLSYRARWDLNLLAILLAFAAFHYHWLEETSLTLAQARPYGASAVLLVAVAAALVHYRKEYGAGIFEKLPAAVHILNWSAAGLSLVRYSTGSEWAPPLLALAAVLAAVLARVARKKGIRWLYVTDTLVSQVVALFAILLLKRFSLGEMDLALLALLEITLFHVLCATQGDLLLMRVLFVFEWVAFVVVQSVGVGHLLGPTVSSPELATRLLLASLVVLAQMAVYVRMGRSLDDPRFVFRGEANLKGAFSPLSIAAPLGILVAYLTVIDETYAAPGLTVVLAALFIFRVGTDAASLNRSLFLTLAGAHVLYFFKMHDLLATGPRAVALVGLPLLILDVGLLVGPMLWSEAEKRFFTRVGVYFTAAQLTSLTYFLVNPVSDFAPGVAYLLYSLVALEVSAYYRRRTNPFETAKRMADFVLHAGYFFIGMFGMRHVLVHLQSEVSLGPVPLRLAISAFGVAAVVYWIAFAPQTEKATQSKTVRILTAYLWEVVLALVTLTVAVELPQIWHPVVWAALACALFQVTRMRQWPSRLTYYSWVYLVAAAVHLAFVSSGTNTASVAWFDRSQYVGFLAEALQIAYLVLVYKSEGFPPLKDLPRGLGWIQGPLFGFVGRRRNMAVFYPVIFGLAVFLFWRFDKAVLTLLWVLEIFFVFALGIFLREKHFVSVALACLAACIVRLIGYDLSQTLLAVRAGVFVGIGLLMLGINALYRRFKDRLQ